MKPINVYTLTRLTSISCLQRLERQMSGRKHFLQIKEWEVDGLRQLIDQLMITLPEASQLNFYYSFQMPKLGKEFDLLRLSEDYVVNIELKSRMVSNEAIKKQLLQNRYYLAMLGKNTYSYTYISSQNRLVRLSRSGKLMESEFGTLCEDLQKQKNCLEGDIEHLFKEDKFLISPLTDPDRFLRREYFLTYQQRDIKKQILAKIVSKECSYQSFTGLPGTGKTLLLYDIALQLSWREKVCVLHFGAWSRELEQLNQRLKRIDFVNGMGEENLQISDKYAAICVDEGHRMTEKVLHTIINYAEHRKIPVIFSYDSEEMLAPQERIYSGSHLIESLESYTKYKLTNRIRLNEELSSFIQCVVHPARASHRDFYPSVHLAYANCLEEAHIILRNLLAEGYTYIRDKRIDSAGLEYGESMEIQEAACKEFDKVVMLLDHSFFYTEDGYLTSGKSQEEADSKVRCLFHGLSRAKLQVSLVVFHNLQVFERILCMMQRTNR